MVDRPDIKKFKQKALSNKKVKQEYLSLSGEYELRKNLIRIRNAAGYTQEELAKILGTNKSNISRLESVDSKHSPTLATIEEYARTVGYRVEISFKPV